MDPLREFLRRDVEFVQRVRKDIHESGEGIGRRAHEVIFGGSGGT